MDAGTATPADLALYDRALDAMIDAMLQTKGCPIPSSIETVKEISHVR